MMAFETFYYRSISNLLEHLGPLLRLTNGFISYIYYE